MEDNKRVLNDRGKEFLDEIVDTAIKINLMIADIESK